MEQSEGGCRVKHVYKYELSKNSEVKIRIHDNAKIIHIGLDPHHILCIWAEVDITMPMSEYTFFIVGTGHLVPEGVQHFASVMDGAFMWHVYRPTSERF